jgi:hypothetical protein
MLITYRIDPNMQNLAADIGISFDRLREKIREGLSLFQHFWDHEIRETPRGQLRFKVTKATGKRIHWWAWRVGNTLNFNRFVKSTLTGQPLKWNEGGLVFGAAHESGHALLSAYHIENGPYYNDPSWGHVMALSSYWYQGSFSPLEVWYGHTKLKWPIKANARHPYCDQWLALGLADRAANLPLLIKICTPYAELGLYRPIGNASIDQLMASVKQIPNAILLFE